MITLTSLRDVERYVQDGYTVVAVKKTATGKEYTLSHPGHPEAPQPPAVSAQLETQTSPVQPQDQNDDDIQCTLFDKSPGRRRRKQR